MYQAIELREIESLYDLTPTRRIAGSKSGPPTPLYSPTGEGGRWFDLKGTRTEPSLEDARVQLPLRGSAEFLRTFDRRRSGRVADRWVYVFETSGPNTDLGNLVHELRFGEDGFFQFVLPDRSTLDPGKHAYLQLPVHGHYYLYLAAYPLPDEAIQQMGTRLRSRAIYLKDDFYLDANDGDCPDPESARPHFLREMENDLPSGGNVSYVLHLPCVLGEGCRRAQLLRDVLAELFEQIKRRQDPNNKVELAHRIDLFTRSRGVRRFVAHELESCLKSSEGQRIEGLELVAEELCHDLVEWIGTRETPRLLRSLDGDEFLVHEAEGAQPQRWRPAGPIGTFVRGLLELPACNAFTLAANDYASADEAVVDAVATIVAFVHHDLDAIPEGRAWLKDNFERLDLASAASPGHSLPVQGTEQAGTSRKPLATISDWDDALAPIDAGAKVFVEGKAIRKRLADPVGYILKSYSIFFAAGVKNFGLSSFPRFMRVHLGAEVDYRKATLTSAEKRTVIEERALYGKAKDLEGKRSGLKSQLNGLAPDDSRRAAVKKELDELETVELAPRWKTKMQGCKNTLDGLGLAVNVADLYGKLRYLSQHRDDGKAYLEVAKSSAATLESLQTVKQIEWQGKLFRTARTPAFNYFGFAKNLLSFFGELNTLQELQDPNSGKHDRGEIRGHSLAAFGYAASAAAVVLSGGTALVVGIVGFLLTEAGAFIADQFSDAALFLRACTFAQDTFDWEGVKADTASATKDVAPSPNPLNAPIAVGKVGLSFLGATADWGIAKLHDKDIAEYWYTGPRDKFRDDFPAQHNALDQIQHDYDPAAILTPDLGRLLLEFEVFNPILLDPSTVWSISGSFGIIDRVKGRTGFQEPAVIMTQKIERTGVPLLEVTNPRFAFKTRYAVEVGLVPKVDVRAGNSPLRDAKFIGAITATVRAGRSIRVTRKLQDRKSPPPGFQGDPLIYGVGKHVDPEFAYPSTVVIRPLHQTTAPQPRGERPTERASS